MDALKSLTRMVGVRLHAPLVLFVVFALLVGACRPKLQYNDPVPVHESFTMASTALDEQRTINVWLPPGYADGEAPLPVLYMLDGGIHEDFPHLANTVADLVEANRIVPIILVGIANTERRRDLSPPTTVEKDKAIASVVGGAPRFRSFISDELIPEIDARYRTSVNRTLIGESLAGLFAVETLLRTPDVFDNVIAFDPSLWWDNHVLVTQADSLLRALPDTPKRLWFAGSDAPDIQVHTRALAERLDAKAPFLLNWSYTDAPEEKHWTIFRATKTKALLWMFGNEGSKHMPQR